ncbi:MAG: hypothetical protein JSR17_00420 [Proteobacteria bacterium]|nr:hypothetical protein [Pseudomonadota bacterium]
MMNTLSIEKLYESQQTLLDMLKTKQDVFAKIKTVNYPLIVKWQMMLGVLLPIQFEILKKIGFTNEQTALIEYNAQLMQTQKDDQKLRELNEAKWNYIFEQAFDITSVQKISQEQALALIKDISIEMMSENFLKQVDAFMAKLDPNMPLIEKRQHLLTLLIPMQMSVMSKHGFAGEQGYVQAQKALMEYLHEPQMIEQASKAQIALFTRAGLMG